MNINTEINGLIIKDDSFSFKYLTGFQHYTKYAGEDIIVAVMDTGVKHHKDLDGKLLEGANFYNKKTYPWNGFYDDNGHGTHVAGTIVGTKCGIAPKAKIIPVNCFNSLGEGYLEDIIKGCKFILNWKDENGNKIDIVNMSFGFKVTEDEKVEEFRSLVKEMVDNNICVICSSGNNGFEHQTYPGMFQDPITVGAVDIEKNIANFSTRSNEVDVCQVGVGILSCYIDEESYIYKSGTSMSCPLVVGIAALLASKYKKQFKETIPENLLYKTLKLNSYDLGIEGVDDNYGAGFCSLNPTPTKIHAQIDNNIMTINGVQITLPQAPILYNNKTLVPIREITEAIKANVEWVSEGKHINIIV